MPARKGDYRGGLTGRDFEKLDNLNPGRVDKAWPADSQGNKESLPPVSIINDKMPKGHFMTVPGGAEIVDPVVSEAQRRAMYAASQGKSRLGISRKVGEEFIASSHGVTNLPERVGG